MMTFPVMNGLWHELRNAFRPASLAGATVWDRVRAATWLRERFIPRFRAEREMAAELVELLEPQEANPLWDATDRVETQVDRLTRLATVHHGTDEFRVATEALVVALEEWSDALDIAADHLRGSDLHLV
jgi:hypothetical protein